MNSSRRVSAFGTLDSRVGNVNETPTSNAPMPAIARTRIISSQPGIACEFHLGAARLHTAASCAASCDSVASATCPKSCGRVCLLLAASSQQLCESDRASLPEEAGQSSALGGTHSVL